MSTKLKPWMKATFELIVHAEIHLREGGDFDRRIAHIGFDNAIEVAINTYLGLNPIQRNGKQYPRSDVDRWLTNYHTKLEFLNIEVGARGRSLQVPTDEIVYFHDIRNNQYHAGGPGIPEAEHLEEIRRAALDVFAILFDVSNVEVLLDECLKERSKEDDTRPRNATVDNLLDLTGEPVNILGVPYKVSEALYATDPESYHSIVAAVSESRNVLKEFSSKYPGYIRSGITHVGFVHYEEVVYLKTLETDGEIHLIDTDFISDDGDVQFFSSRSSPDKNADLLVNEFDPYSIINCFDLFTDRAKEKIAREFGKLHREPN